MITQDAKACKSRLLATDFQAEAVIAQEARRLGNVGLASARKRKLNTVILLFSVVTQRLLSSSSSSIPWGVL